MPVYIYMPFYIKSTDFIYKCQSLIDFRFFFQLKIYSSLLLVNDIEEFPLFMFLIDGLNLSFSLRMKNMQ